MNQEIKQKLQQAATEFGKLCDPNNETIEKQADLRFGFLRGAQTILENPHEWGLVHPHSQKLAEEVLAMESQLAKYREALERIIGLTEDHPDYEYFNKIAKEVLKQ